MMCKRLPPGSGRMEKRRTTIVANIAYVYMIHIHTYMYIYANMYAINAIYTLTCMASLSCASILCAVVLLITNASIRHAVE